MTEFSGRAEPDRILPLLWRNSAAAPARRAGGRPPKLTVDAVVAAAVRLADAEGLAATSMARVAATLEVGTMTLYTYVPSRADLIDLMVDDVLLRRALPGPDGPGPAGWRDRIRWYADRTRTMYAEHPWLAQVALVRPPIGPGMLAEREYVLSAVSALGLPPERVNAAALAVQTFVTAAARAVAESIELRRATGQSNDAWWTQRGRLWEDYFDVDRHPVMTELWHAGAFAGGADEQLESAYDYGLRLLLDGIAAEAR